MNRPSTPSATNAIDDPSGETTGTEANVVALGGRIVCATVATARLCVENTTIAARAASAAGTLQAMPRHAVPHHPPRRRQDRKARPAVTASSATARSAAD